MKDTLDPLLDGTDLDRDAARQLMASIMDDELTDAQAGAVLAALRAKGVTPEEVAGFAEAMRKSALPLRVDTDRPLIDTCGTGGASTRTFSVSTSSAFVVAACGGAVAKHGNRSHSSACGSADLIEALGVSLDMGPTPVARVLEVTGVGFMFAPKFHPAMGAVAGVREELEVRTVFNILGPLTNPAGVRRQVLGVYDPDLIPLMAEALVELEAERAFVVHGHPGMDEVSPAGPTEYARVEDGTVRRSRVTPEDLGISPCDPEDVDPLEPDDMVEMLRDIFAGFRGPRRDMILINAAFGVVAAGLADDLEDGFEQARKAVDSGAALETLDAFVEEAQARR